MSSRVKERYDLRHELGSHTYEMYMRKNGSSSDVVRAKRSMSSVYAFTRARQF